jgi:hypothetical protein
MAEVDDLAPIKGAALATLNTAVNGLREQFVTPLSGQEMIYMAKASEAVAFQADAKPDAVKYPLVYAEVGLTAPDAAGVAAVVQGKDVAWTQIAAAIETARLTGERDIGAAKDPDAINAALWTATATLGGLAKQAGVSG